MLTTLTYPSNLPSNLKAVPIVDLRTMLPVNPRYTWETLHAPRSKDKLTTIVFHHDAITKASSKAYDDKALAVRIAQSHIATTRNIPGGDPGFPYHAWIRNGAIYIANNPEALTYGVASNNTNTIHISVSGDYANQDKLTDQDRTALYAAYFLFKGWMTAFSRLVGHKELTPTQCPGYDMAVVRSDLAALEEQIAYNFTPNADRALCYAFAERVDDLGKRRSDPKWGAAAEAKIMWLAPAMTALNVTDELTPDYIVKYWKRVYDNSYNDKFSGEAFRKLLVGANLAKDKGLLS